MGRKVSSGFLKTVAFGATAAVAGAGLMFIPYVRQLKLPSQAYTLKGVTDGDSFYLTNGLEIRLANIDAPELGRCGSEEAKEGLQKLLTGKPIYLNIITEDQYHRLVSMVYTDKVFVNAEILRLGLATYPSSTAGYNDILRSTIDEARQKGRGIHVPPCTQKVNAVNSSCNIKGNIKDGNKYYYAPSCAWYDQAYVQLYLGEKWFCTEKEAQKAGYTKAPRCR